MLICEIDCKYYLNRVEAQYFAPVNSKPNCKIFGFIIDVSQSNFEKTRGFAKRLGARSPQRA